MGHKAATAKRLASAVRWVSRRAVSIPPEQRRTFRRYEFGSAAVFLAAAVAFTPACAPVLSALNAYLARRSEPSIVVLLPAEFLWWSAACLLGMGIGLLGQDLAMQRMLRARHADYVRYINRTGVNVRRLYQGIGLVFVAGAIGFAVFCLPVHARFTQSRLVDSGWLGSTDRVVDYRDVTGVRLEYGVMPATKTRPARVSDHRTLTLLLRDGSRWTTGNGMYAGDTDRLYQAAYTVAEKAGLTVEYPDR